MNNNFHYKSLRIVGCALLGFALTLGCGVVGGGGGGGTQISRQSGPFQPQQPGYDYREGVVYYQGAPLMRVAQTDVDKFTTHYQVYHTDGSLQAEVTLASSYGGTLDCRAIFPTLGVHYEVRYPIIAFTELLASYIDNKVLVQGRADPQGLQGYAASRGFQVVDTAAQFKRLSEAGQKAMCRRCEEDYRRCQVDASYRRDHPAPGITVSKSCELQFQECSQGGILTRTDEWPCGPPPP